MYGHVRSCMVMYGHVRSCTCDSEILTSSPPLSKDFLGRDLELLSYVGLLFAVRIRWTGHH